MTQSDSQLKDILIHYECHSASTRLTAPQPPPETFGFATPVSIKTWHLATRLPLSLRPRQLDKLRAFEFIRILVAVQHLRGFQMTWNAAIRG
jgi:hypothetical protein